MPRKRFLAPRGGAYHEVTPSVTVSGLTTPPSGLRQDTVSRGGDRRAEETGYGDDSLSFAANINVGQRHRLGGARETPPRSGNAPNNGAFPSSQVVKATPWLCQECTCSPSTREARKLTFDALPKSTEPSRVPLRWLPQFALCLGLIVREGHQSSWAITPLKIAAARSSRNLFCAAKEIRELR